MMRILKAIGMFITLVVTLIVMAAIGVLGMMVQSLIGLAVVGGVILFALYAIYVAATTKDV